MLKNAKISTKIIILVLSIVGVVVALELILSYQKKQEIVHDAYEEELGAIADVQDHNIKREFEIIKQDIENLQNSQLLIDFLGHILSDSSAGGDQELLDNFNKKVILPFEKIYDFENIILIGVNEELLYQFKEQPFDTLKLKLSLDQRKTGFYHDKVSKEEGTYYTYASLPISNDNGEMLAIAVCKIDVNDFIRRHIFAVGLKNTGEIIVGVLNDRIVENIYSTARLAENVPKVINEDDPLFQACTGASGFGEYIDYEGMENLAVWKPIHELGLGMVIKIHSSETDNTLATIYYLLSIKGMFAMVVALCLGLLIAGRLTKPIRRLKEALDILSIGDLPPPVLVDSDDEIGEMTDVVNKHVDQLKKTSEFALQIGQGGYESAGYDPISDKDILGHSLLFMQQSLLEATEKDDKRGWIFGGIAELGDVMRVETRIEDLTAAVVKYLYGRVNARQAVVYLCVDGANGKVNLKQTASFAYGKQKFIDRSYQIGEGLIGQCALELDTIMRTEIPSSYDFIRSGKKDDLPPVLILMVPLISNEQLIGVLELTFDHFCQDNEVIFIEEVSEKIAQTVYNIQINAHTQDLLEEVSHAQTRIQALLENASEVIIIYEDDATIRYISPSVENILGYTQDELIGRKDTEYIHEKGLADFEELFEALLNHPKKQKVVTYSYVAKSGERVWLEATGKNMINDPAINGLVVNLRDITERRRAKLEESKRGQMQALSENSLDLIVRISSLGQFFYANPVFEKLTGISPDEVIGKSLNEAGLPGWLVDEWDNVLRQVFLNQEEYTVEMDFVTPEETKVMHVSAIPEFNDSKKIMSVLMVSHDITRRKAIENEINRKNQKINQSINSAERIQGTILPEEQLIRTYFPDSFVMFRPRDIVSGDFPYFFERGDDKYMAAVDCTGHGVPGALISIVAYFLLNDVIESNEVQSCGEILDTLDRLVTKTLRQDQPDAQLKDGMDIALVRINTKENTVEYAGAHRPLYLFRGMEFVEIKGDKWPIGGGKAYKNKSKFNNTITKIGDRDAVYFFSDGFPDQFGGPENRKFGSKRLKRLLEEIHDQSMFEQRERLVQEFEKWKGETKQTDDVILFGLRNT